MTGDAPGSGAREPAPDAPGRTVYERPVPAGDLARVVLAHNPSEMTFEGTNTWLLAAPGARGCVVVDPGPELADHHEAVAAAAGTVELVLVTHRHPDHTDGIDGLYALVGAPVRASAERYCREASPLADGEVVHAAGLDLEVVATPGHTADSLSLLVRRSGQERVEAVVLGDTILGRDSTVLDSVDGDLGAYLASLDRLRAAASGVPGLPGHGPVVPDTAAMAAHLAEHRRARLERVRAARAELGPDASVTEVTARAYEGEGLSPFLLAVAEKSTEVALRHLDVEQSR